MAHFEEKDETVVNNQPAEKSILDEIMTRDLEKGDFVIDGVVVEHPEVEGSVIEQSAEEGQGIGGPVDETDLESIKAHNLFDLRQTIAHEIFSGVNYPWEALSKINGFIPWLGSTLNPAEYDKVDDNIWIAKSAKIMTSVHISGPAIIGKNAEIRHGAFIRGNAIVGNGSVVGNSTELKNVILFNKVEVPHFNYVGDSILGYKAHLGAGAITSNVRSDKQLVAVKLPTRKIETGLKKFGAMIGDEVEIGCGTVLNPGCIIGKRSIIYPVSSVRGVIVADSIYKTETEVSKRFYG